MDKSTQRAAARAADKLLKAAGYDPRGKSLRKVMAKRKAEVMARAAAARKLRKAKGFSLIETLLVLGVIALMLVAAFVV